MIRLGCLPSNAFSPKNINPPELKSRYTLYQALEDYYAGEALILSFINTNVEDKDSDAFKKVEAWETAFLSLMLNVTTDFNDDGSENSKRLKNFDMAYFSERSIEDEIDATTESDLGIFVASYVIIFVYIMSALGSYSSIKLGCSKAFCRKFQQILNFPYNLMKAYPS